MKDTLILNASEILTMEGSGWEPLKSEKMKRLKVMENSAILIREGIIREIMTSEKAEKYMKGNSIHAVDAKGNVVMPGLVDSHTHIVYAGTREEEFYQKISGNGYMEILASGNGIYRTVRDTRSSSGDEIFSQSMKRVYESVSTGTTSMEIKTGYGLDLSTETKMLEVIHRIKNTGIVNVIPTFLGMHAIPQGQRENEYSNYVISAMFPRMKDRVKFVDVFCDRGAFSVSSTSEMAEVAKANGLRLKLHCDEFADIGCLDLCEKYHPLTVDHLLVTDQRGMDKIARSGTIATFLPMTAFNVADGKYNDIGAFIRRGIPVALASDASPVSYNSNLFFAMHLAVKYCRMSIEEALNAATINGAFACGMEGQYGSIESGKNADIIILNVDSYRKIPYEYGIRMVNSVMRNGELIYRDGAFRS
ncbi:imidazolonepropionase [Oxyplasma meridianum]|uniref:Imidazolonepropionase n=1 Tax=Oxyplasma meridianum TaxID=3073602 RepID=A0AAX4NH90_9ARCH